MAYTYEQVAEIVTDAAIKADWKHIQFTRSKHEISIVFGKCLMLDGFNDCDYFYINFSCTAEYDGARFTMWTDEGDDIHAELKKHVVTEDEWFTEVEKYFSEICGIHLKTAEEKTA